MILSNDKTEHTEKKPVKLNAALIGGLIPGFFFFGWGFINSLHVLLEATPYTVKFFVALIATGLSFRWFTLLLILMFYFTLKTLSARRKNELEISGNIQE